MPAQDNESLPPRKLANWVSAFVEYTEGVKSNKLFRKWAAITTIGACLERRVWTITAKRPTFPNLFTILIAPPGIGKSEAITIAGALVKNTGVDLANPIPPACNLAPTDVTKGAFLDWLASKQVRKLGPCPEAEALGIAEEYDYHAAFMVVSELGNLVREYDSQLLNKLHDIYDSIAPVDEARRYRDDKPILIQRPLLSLLAGTTPAYIARSFPESAWDEGFIARCVLIYNDDPERVDLFDESMSDQLLARELVEDLRQIGKMAGKMSFSDDYKKAMRAWQAADYEPKPTYQRLVHYNTRRERLALKLSMIAAANRSNSMTITSLDLQEALAWMIEAEQKMPQIFMEMTGSSEGQIMNQLYHFVHAFYDNKLNLGKSMPKSMLYRYLAHRVHSWQVQSVIDMAVESEVLVAKEIPGRGVEYIPHPKARLHKKPGR